MTSLEMLGGVIAVLKKKLHECDWLGHMIEVHRLTFHMHTSHIIVYASTP